MIRAVHVDIPSEELTQEVLQQALAGRLDTIPPSAALSLLSDADIPGTDGHAVLQDAMQNDDFEPHVRAGAVKVYMRAAGEGAVPALLQALESSEESVAASAASALGHVGSPKHLEALHRLRSGKGGVLSTRAAFAEALIVHRFGLADRDVEMDSTETQATPVTTGALAFVGVKPGPGRKDQALKAIKRDLPWFDIGKQEVYEVQCGPRLLEVAVNRDFMGSDGPGKLSKRPATPTVIAMQDVEYDDYYPGLIGLTRPTGKNRIKLELTRLTGEPVYVGEGTVERGEIAVDLRAAQAPGVAAVAGRIRLTAEGVEISGISGRRSAPKKNPEKE